MHTAKHISKLIQGRWYTSGFSLIELVLVLAIISVLAAIAVPKYANSLARYRADAAARRMAADLNYARQHARSTSASVTVWVRPSNNNVKIIDVPDPDQPASLHTTTPLADAPYHAEIVSSDFGGDVLIIFDGYGYPDSGGSAVVTVGAESRTVVLNPDSGKAVVQ